MAESSANIREIARILTSQISAGWHYFVIAKFIREAYEKGKIQEAHTIFTNSYSACWDSAILAVTKVINKQKGSLSLGYMLNCIKAAPHNYPSLTLAELHKQVADHRQELDNLEAKIAGVWGERDRVVAHLDRKHVTDPASVYSNPPLELDDLHSAIRTLRRILLIYNTQLEAGGISIDESESIWDDLQKLIQHLDKDHSNSP